MSTAAVRVEATAVPNTVILQIDNPAVSEGLQQALAQAGFEVHAAAQFKDLAAWLILCRDATLVIALPAIDVFRKAVLREVRRLAPTARIVALVPSPTPDAEHDAAEAKVIALLPANAAPTEIIDKICS